MLSVDPNEYVTSRYNVGQTRDKIIRDNNW